MAYANDDDIVTLVANNGEEIDFVNIAGINYRGKYYAILQPVELLDGMSDDEALVFEVIRNGGGDANYNIVTNDSIIDGVFREYNRLLDKQKGGNGKKLKKGGAGKVFGAAKVVAKTTMWIVKFVICLAITLAGAGFLIGAIVMFTQEGDLIAAIILGVIGAVGLILGGRGVIGLIKKRKH